MNMAAIVSIFIITMLIKLLYFNHLIGDMNRIYTNLMYEYVYYMLYLKHNYPYMISIALRTNPFDMDADIHVKE